MTMPTNYVEMTDEEMMYVDGGVAAPNWLVALGINSGVNLGISWLMGGGGIIALGKAAIKAFGRGTVTRYLKSALSSFIAVKLANSIAGVLCDFIIGSGGWSVGEVAANWWDSRDAVRNNGWCEF